MDGSTPGLAYYRPKSIHNILALHINLFFFPRGSLLQLRLLLQIAGIELNPGPNNTTWFSSVWQLELRNNITSVQCNGCQNWCHMRKCTNLTAHRNWSPQFMAKCCNLPPNLVNPLQPSSTPF